MSKVAFVLKNMKGHKAEVVKALRAIDNLGVTDIMSAEGSLTPLFIRKLFDRDFPDFPLQLLSLMIELNELNVAYEVYELLDDQKFLSSSQSRYFKINPIILHSMIKSRRLSLGQQRRLSELGM